MVVIIKCGVKFLSYMFFMYYSESIFPDTTLLMECGRFYSYIKYV
jgi:hypothetical protein